MPGLAFIVAYCLPHRFLATIDSFVWQREYDRIFDRYPWPSPDFTWWQQRYGLQFVMTTREVVTGLHQGVKYDFTPLQLIFKNEHFCLYRSGPFEAQRYHLKK